MDQHRSSVDPLVSVIINCYNGEKYLQEAINSVLSQTYKNWEIIFWDNQSHDNSAKIFKSFCDGPFMYNGKSFAKTWMR